MKNISLKSVIISSIASFGLMVLFIVILGALYSMLHAGEGTPDEVSKNFANSWLANLALTAPIFAGYLAARIAQRRPVLHGTLSTSLNVLWGLFCLIFLGPLPGFAILILIINPFLGMLGGYIWLTTHFDKEISDI